MAGCLLLEGDFEFGAHDGDFGSGGIDGCVERVEGEVICRAGRERELERYLYRFGFVSYKSHRRPKVGLDRAHRVIL